MLLCYVIDSGLSTSLLLLATLIILFYIYITLLEVSTATQRRVSRTCNVWTCREWRVPYPLSVPLRSGTQRCRRPCAHHPHSHRAQLSTQPATVSHSTAQRPTFTQSHKLPIALTNVIFLYSCTFYFFTLFLHYCVQSGTAAIPNKCIRDNTKADAHHSPNCIFKKSK